MGQNPGSDSALQGFEENETDKLFIRDIVAFILFLNGGRPMPKRECERSTDSLQPRTYNPSLLLLHCRLDKCSTSPLRALELAID
jgi:hypothetical protein